MEILAVEALSFRYPETGGDAVGNVSFTLEKGDFLTVAGATGCGKSTLLRLLKRELTPLGEQSGAVRYMGRPMSELSDRESAAKIGFVMQRPEQQTVSDKVWHELAFGLENLGLDRNAIRRRAAETACYLGIEELFEKNTSELSGGQKQLLALASVMVMQPEILILDEPTSQLDPIAASAFISTVSKLNRELSLTVIIVEHRTDEVIPISNKLLIMDKGGVYAFGETCETIEKIRGNERLLEAMPSAVRIYGGMSVRGKCPLDVREGRSFIEAHLPGGGSRRIGETEYVHSSSPALEFRNVYFKYSKNLPDILRGTDFTVYEGEIFCILGGNGSGKSTSLRAAAGLLKPYSGEIRIFGKRLSEYKNQSLYRGCLTMLPQDVQTVFLKNTVREELEEVGADCLAALPFDLTAHYDKHPYDLSGGEQQLTALAKVMATNPRILLLDEPTKGLDAYARKKMISVLRTLKNDGITVITVTHDAEFAASVSDRCAMFFRGEVISTGTPRTFFSDNSYYTTSVSRMTRGIFDNAVTVSDAVRLLTCGNTDAQIGV